MLTHARAREVAAEEEKEENLKQQQQQRQRHLSPTSVPMAGQFTETSVILLILRLEHGQKPEDAVRTKEPT